MPPLGPACRHCKPEYQEKLDAYDDIEKLVEATEAKRQELELKQAEQAQANEQVCRRPPLAARPCVVACVWLANMGRALLWTFSKTDFGRLSFGELPRQCLIN